jgi:hypothetical protein
VLNGVCLPTASIPSRYFCDRFNVAFIMIIILELQRGHFGNCVNGKIILKERPEEQHVTVYIEFIRLEMMYNSWFL